MAFNANGDDDVDVGNDDHDHHNDHDHYNDV